MQARTTPLGRRPGVAAINALLLTSACSLGFDSAALDLVDQDNTPDVSADGASDAPEDTPPEGDTPIEPDAPQDTPDDAPVDADADDATGGGDISPADADPPDAPNDTAPDTPTDDAPVEDVATDIVEPLCGPECRFVGLQGEPALVLHKGGTFMGRSLAVERHPRPMVDRLLVGAPGLDPAAKGRATLVAVEQANRNGDIDGAGIDQWEGMGGHRLGVAVAAGQRGLGANRIVLAAPHASNTQQGSLVHIVGNTSMGREEINFESEPHVTALNRAELLGWSLALADVVGGGNDDLLIGHPKHYLGPDCGELPCEYGAALLFAPLPISGASTRQDATARFMGPNSRSAFGQSVALLADPLPAEAPYHGYVLIGAPGETAEDSTLRGAAYLFSAAHTGDVTSAQAIWSWTGQPQDRLGTVVAAGGPLLSGSTPDAFILTAPGPPQDGAGQVHIFPTLASTLGATSPPTATISGNPGDNLGVAIAVGDLDADGHPDLLIARHPHASADQLPLVHLFYGPIMPGRYPASAAHASFPGPGSTITERTVALAAGDLNGDGLDDVAIGYPHADDSKGEIWIYYSHRPR